MNDFYTMSPEGRNRLLAKLRQDNDYVKGRNILLIVSAGCAVCLAVIGWLLMTDMVGMWVVIVVLAACVIADMVAMFRFVLLRKNILGRLMAGGSPRKVNKNNRAGRASR